jgi:hypothetical protein
VLRIDHLCNAPLLVEQRYAGGGFVPGEVLDCLQQPRFLLPDDLIQLCSPHACSLEILERLSCVYTLVLAGIAYE